jgi:KDO2-lipid IV(A) lauroyltransferase
VCGHYGNFELSGFMLGILGLSSFTIARTLDNPYLDRFVNKFRGAKGQFILPKNGSAQRIDALLASGGTLVFLADQNAGPKGCWVDFFGRAASTHKAIALFTLTNDAPMVVCFARRTHGPLHMKLGMEALADPRDHHAATSVPALTQWYTTCLEQVIRRAPEQYWWVHRRWKDTRTKSAERKAA